MSRTVTVGVTAPTPTPNPVSIGTGQITGRCIGWPTPRIEIQWSANPPPGAAPKNINSVLKYVDGGPGGWFFGGGFPGTDAYRISGALAPAWGAGGYPNPNYGVYDLRDADVLDGETYSYEAKYRPETPSINTYQVTVNQANCSGTSSGPTVFLTSNPKFISGGGSTTLSWSSTNSSSCTASGAWSGTKGTSGSQVVSNIQNSSTYNLTCSNGTSQATTSTVVTIGAAPPPDGTIRGTCSWNTNANAPQVNLVWSGNPPPGMGVADMNGLQKGDLFPNDTGLYWGTVPTTIPQRTYTDTAISLNTQYQYRLQYRSDLVSTNTYTIFVSTANCGGPAPTPGPLVLSPGTGIVPPSVTAFLSATGGTGVYTWEAPGGTITGSGSTIGVTYPNNETTTVSNTVTVRSGNQTATATVQVAGVETFSDSILLTAMGSRFVQINNDASYTNSSNISLTLGHGFVGVASSSVLVRLSNVQADVATAPLVPFQELMAWDICSGLALCPEGLYTVYAIFQDPNGVQSPVVFDTVTFVAGPPGLPRVTINNDASLTTDRTVSLTLWHGFGVGIADNEVTMRIANSPELLATADPTDFAPSVTGWDMCGGFGFSCPNGSKSVYVQFCARGICQVVVVDAINLQSPWPDWGVIVNDDSATTLATDVALQLNPWFNKPGTKILISNLEDMSDAIPQSYSDIVAWNLCYNRPGPCVPATYPVYVKYINPTGSGWPSTMSPAYQDDIAFTTTNCLARPACLDAQPACSMVEPIVGWCPVAAPAEILINDGAPLTASRFVTLRFHSPFEAGTISMRPVNESGLSPRDKDVIAVEYGGGTNSQPAASQTGDNTRGSTSLGTTVPTNVHSEIESGTARPFVTTIASWDLCQGSIECPFGTYKILVQFYRAPVANSTNGTLAAIGDEVSEVYYDVIDYGVATPTPAVSVTPTPPGITPAGTPGGLPVAGPGSGGSGSGFGSVPSWLSSFVDAIRRTFAGVSDIIGSISIAAAAAVGVSAALALVSIFSSSGAGSFLWQRIMGMFGLLPKRKKVWGTVYDANTKRPIPFAKVQLMDRNKRVLETHVADKDGRYGFLTTPESLQSQNVQISLVPTAEGYVFPARTTATVDTFVYSNLYYGDLITVNNQKLINFDIPMDPVRPSVTPLLIKSPSILLGASTAAIADVGFWLGLLLIPLNVILTPNPFTFGVLFLFLGTASLRIWGISEHPFGTVTDSTTGRPMPFALITLNDLSGKRVGFTVSDEQGRYFLVTGRGTYEMAIFTPAAVIPTRQKKQIIEAKKGWITREIKL